MRQAIHRPFNRTQVMSFGFLTVLLSLLQPIPTVSAQQHSTKFVEKKDAQTFTRTPHRLIRKQPNAPVASVEHAPSGTAPVSSLPAAQPSLQTDNSTLQSTEPSALHRSSAVTTPLATMSVAPSLATTMGSHAASMASTGTIPLAAPGNGKGHSSTSGGGNTGGRSMSKLAEELPGLTQLISPPSAPAVSVNPTVGATIGANPGSFSFTAQAGSNPAAQILSVSNTGDILTWSASGNAAWLTVSPASGTGSGAVTLSVATGTLAAGIYSGAVTLHATGATPVTVPVSFTVTAAPVPPAIGASPLSLSFTAQQGGANPATQTLNISNTGSGTLSWTATDNAPWMTLSRTSGTNNGVLIVSVIPGTTSPGTHNGMITLSATGASSVSVPVTFTVTTAPAPPPPPPLTIPPAPNGLRITIAQ